MLPDSRSTSLWLTAEDRQLSYCLITLIFASDAARATSSSNYSLLAFSSASCRSIACFFFKEACLTSSAALSASADIRTEEVVEAVDLPSTDPCYLCFLLEVTDTEVILSSGFISRSHCTACSAFSATCFIHLLTALMNLSHEQALGSNHVCWSFA